MAESMERGEEENVRFMVSDQRNTEQYSNLYQRYPYQQHQFQQPFQHQYFGFNFLPRSRPSLEPNTATEPATATEELSPVVVKPTSNNDDEEHNEISDEEEDPYDDVADDEMIERNRRYLLGFRTAAEVGGCKCPHK